MLCAHLYVSHQIQVRELDEERDRNGEHQGKKLLKVIFIYDVYNLN